MPEPVRIFVSGYYGYANPGDEAILSVLVGELREHIPSVQIAVLSGNPEETAATYGVEAVLWSDPSAIAAAVRAADLVITGGGGIFHDYGGFAEEGLLSEGNWGLGFHVTAGLLAALFGKPMVIYGAGVGPLFSERGRGYVRAVCEGASYISVRDEASARLLEEIGVEKSRVRVTADPAFLFQAEQREPSAQIGVVIRHWKHDVDLESWEREVAAGLDAFLERNTDVSVLFVPFQQLEGEQENDAAVSRRVAALMRYGMRTEVSSPSHSVREKAELLSKCRLVVAMRLHALIFCATSNVPTVALVYDEKVRQAAKRTRRDAFVIEMGELKGPLLASMMEGALTAPIEDVANLRDLARENTTAVIDVLAGAGEPRRILQGESLDLVREALVSLLAEQKRLRTWLRDQKTNYEYQIGVQRGEIEQRTQQGAQLSSELESERRQKDVALEARVTVEGWLEETKLRLAQTEEQRTQWEQRAVALDEDKSGLQRSLADLTQQHVALGEQHRQTVEDWENYSGEMGRRLTEYRSQRAWRGMLAIRKAYVLWVKKGWRLRMLPWMWNVLRGRGSVESEQLEFPLPPKKRG